MKKVVFVKGLVRLGRADVVWERRSGWASFAGGARAEGSSWGASTELRMHATTVAQGVALFLLGGYVAAVLPRPLEADKRATRGFFRRHRTVDSKKTKKPPAGSTKRGGR